MSRFSIALVSSAVVLFVSAPAFAQDPAPAPAAPAAPAAAPSLEGAKQPQLSVALERVGGVAYAKASDDTGDNALSVTAFGVGGVTPNPFAIPRVGIDYITSGGVTVGGAVGFSRVSASTTSGSKTTDVGSVILYTLTPRVGYRIPLSDRVDLTPRAGLTLAGASASPSDSSTSASIFAIAIGADAPFAFRLTDSFNLLAGAAIDYTVSAKVTTESPTTTTTVGPGGTTQTSTRTSTDDVKGSLFSMQAWLGVGGYL